MQRTQWCGAETGWDGGEDGASARAGEVCAAAPPRWWYGERFIKRVRTEGTERGVWAGAVHVRVRVVGGVVGGADEQVE